MALALDPISVALDIGGKLIDKLWPDPAKADAAKLELLKMAQAGELAHLTAETELAKGQIATNTAEAQNANVFVSGWRPFIGWVCGLGLFSQFIVRPFAMFVAGIFGKVIEYPSLDLGTLTTLLFGMLGLGVLRTAEKIKGTK